MICPVGWLRSLVTVLWLDVFYPAGVLFLMALCALVPLGIALYFSKGTF